MRFILLFFLAAAPGVAPPCLAASAAPPQRPRPDPHTDSAPTSAPDPAESDPVIRFHEERLAADPGDTFLLTRLGAVCLEKAREHGDYRLFRKAEAVLSKAAAEEPESAKVRVLLASAYMGQHKFREAVAAGGQAVKLDPGGAEGYAILGDACLESGDPARAGEMYAKMHELNPGVLSSVRLANLDFQRGDSKAALAHMDEALGYAEETAPPPGLLAWCLVRLGGMHFRTGDWDSAEARYGQALELKPDDPSALDHLGELRAAQKKYDEAVSLYGKVVALSPRPEFFQALGDVYAAMGPAKAADAKAWHDKALAGYLAAAEAGNAHYYHHLAGFYCDSRPNGAEALKWAKKDLGVRRTAASLDALAWAHYAAGQYPEAAAAADDALAAGTNDAHVLYHTGLIYLRVGQPAKAKGCLERAAKANPKFNEFHVHR